MKSILRSFLVLTALLIMGCGGADVTAPAQAVTPVTGTVVVRNTLQRAVPAEVTNFVFTGYDADGRRLLGPDTRPKASEVRLDVPTNLRTLHIRYSDGHRTLGTYKTELSVQQGQEVVVEDPNFSTGTTFIPTSAVMILGTSGQIAAVDSQGKPVAVQWTTDSDTLSINPQGIVTANGIGIGFGNVFADGQLVTDIQVLDQPASLGELNVIPTSGNVAIAGTTRFVVMATGPGRDLLGASWSTDPNSLDASVDSNGVVTGLSVGFSVVFASLGQLSGSAQVTVGNP